MHDYKFRIFVKNKLGQPYNKYIYSEEFNDSNNKFITLEFFFKYVNEMECEYKELEQYIGLKDINKEDIYEGDILCIKWGLNNKVITSNYLIKSSLETSCNCCSMIYGWSIDDTENSKIIGNINENPELLEKIK